MKTESSSSVEFLEKVPLLHRLTSSSLKKIAQVLVFKRYERGDYVVGRDEEEMEGVYFILEGQVWIVTLCDSYEDKRQLQLVMFCFQAQVLGPVGEENCSEFFLKPFDYFGRGIFGNVYAVDVVAVSQLTCLLLTCDHCHLLETKPICDLDNQRSLLERILYMDPLDLNVFRGFTLPNAPALGKVFGGQFVAQGLAAASKTVEFMKLVHSLHAYFLLSGDTNSKDFNLNMLLLASTLLFSSESSLAVPIIYEVSRLRDGNNFATRRVDARQKGKTIFTLFASFQREQQGFDHLESNMPHMLPPETLVPRDEMLQRRMTDHLIPRYYRNKVATQYTAPLPIDIRFCEPNYSTEERKSPSRLKYWFKARGELSDDQALHRCVVAFASDLMYAFISSDPHRKKGMSAVPVSLDHSMWFHRPLRADDWLLFVMVNLTASQSRGLATGEMFNRKGELVVSLKQEALLKETVTSNPILDSKL
ncbi:PREDICTED: acyl-CoA thioesterase 2 isoform X2 [Brassica oleracea var. oleracea]|uniref:acyl-CoA thioesterase 2 isoform X2 n=1 Tax=Brassica oleracea var. oleracea TaxID=109376 RepID=UPI0006A745CF|nr:PREDICTED: acyl-CoA thioesterase 2 isoform X2 [Brassica oleracea var. oleracea]